MNILTIDIEDWYNSFLDFKIKDEDYSVKPTLLRLLNTLETFDIHPTFFVVGDFALKNKEFVCNIAQKYDIGSHGLHHKLVTSQSYKEFREDIVTSVKVLEDITGRKITKYRAPGFSITDKEYLKVLFDTPIEQDCSLSAVNHFYGKKIIDKDVISLVEYQGKRIKEFPPSVIKLFGSCRGFIGGGYFRFFPYSVLKNQLNNRPNGSLIYLHPSDFATDMPKISGLSPWGVIKRKIGVKNAEKKFVRLAKNFVFTDIASADNKTDWSNVPIIEL